nr:MAG TPA: hypothetical protein [Caudoviricetes sp.]
MIKRYLNGCDTILHGIAAVFSSFCTLLGS